MSGIEKGLKELSKRVLALEIKTPRAGIESSSRAIEIEVINEIFAYLFGLGVLTGSLSRLSYLRDLSRRVKSEELLSTEYFNTADGMKFKTSPVGPLVSRPGYRAIEASNLFSSIVKLVDPGATVEPIRIAKAILYDASIGYSL